MIRCSDAAIARGSKTPNQPSDGVASIRVAPGLPLPANQLRVICSATEHPVHPHSQFPRDGHFRHRVSPAKLQELIVLPEFGILSHRMMHRFDQQPEAEAFYRSLQKPVRVGIEATGPMHWFERLLTELGHELWDRRLGKDSRQRSAQAEAVHQERPR